MPAAHQTLLLASLTSRPAPRSAPRARSPKSSRVSPGGSPVYLTQVFKQVEGLPLYGYQMRLRLARALDLLAQYDDLTALSLTSASRATAISAPRSAQRTDAHPRSSGEGRFGVSLSGP